MKVNKKKRILSLILSFALVFSTLGLMEVNASTDDTRYSVKHIQNGGFIWAWNEAKCADKITPEIKKAVEDKIAEFQATPNILANWSEVDYSKL